MALLLLKISIISSLLVISIVICHVLVLIVLTLFLLWILMILLLLISCITLDIPITRMISRFSSPDHILTKCNFSNLIDSVYTSDPVENFSDHLSLHFSFNLSDSLSLLFLPSVLTTIIDILVLAILPLLLIGLKLTQITFLIIVTIFHPSSLSFHLTFLVVVILTVLLTIKTSRTIVFNSSIVLSLQRTYVSPSIVVVVVATLLFLGGITQRIP